MKLQELLNNLQKCAQNSNINNDGNSEIEILLKRESEGKPTCYIFERYALLSESNVSQDEIYELFKIVYDLSKQTSLSFLYYRNISTILGALDNLFIDEIKMIKMKDLLLDYCLIGLGINNPYIDTEQLKYNFNTLSKLGIDGISSALALSEKASVFIITLLKLTIQDKLFYSASLQLVQDLKNTGDSFKDKDAAIYMRFLYLLGDLGSKGDSYFEICESVGMVSDLCSICIDETNPDILLRISCLELLSTYLTKTSAGLKYISQHVIGDKSTVLQWLLRAVTDSAKDPIISVDALRTLSEVFSQSVSLGVDLQLESSSIQSFLESLQRHLESRDEAARIAAVVVVSDFACISSSSLHLVLQAPVAQEWVALLRSSNSDLNAAVLHSVAKVLNRSWPAVQDHHVFQGISPIESMVAMKKRLCLLVAQARGGSAVVQVLMKLSRQPFSAVRHAAIDFMKAMAQQSEGWGITELFQSGTGAVLSTRSEFYRYLTDRSTEFSKEGKEWKFSLIEAVHAALGQQQGLVTVEPAVLDQLTAMLRQGPFYLTPRVEDPQFMDS